MDEVCEEWIRHGLSTDPADRDTAVAGVHNACRASGLTLPRTVVWVDSPLAGANYFYRLCPPVGSFDQLFTPSPDTENDPIGRQVSKRVHSGVLPTYLCIAAQLEADADPTIRPSRLPGLQYRYRARGQFDAGEMCVYDVRLGTRSRPAGAADVSRVAQSAGMWWLSPEVVVLCERPREIHHDRQGRPHRLDGPAVVYPDGWGVYMWHGMRVPARLIEGDGWSMARIVRCRNSEIRRCAVERHAAVAGWDALISRAGWHQVGRTVPDPGNPGQELSLYRVPDIYDMPVNLLLMTNGTTERDGTRRQYAETVPDDVNDPVAAAAWQIGVPTRHYRQSVRRT